MSLSPSISVAENMFLGSLPVGRLGLIDRRKMKENARIWLDMVQADIDPGVLVSTLPVAKQQLVQIAKSLSSHARILILDEPFSALSDRESENLFQVIRRLKEDGMSVIYIDHRIDNFFRISDRITVLRDGRKIGTLNTADADRAGIIRMMVGRDTSGLYPKSNRVGEEIGFSVRNLTSRRVSGISFDIHRGEVLGLAGLVGAGRTEVMDAIFGIDKTVSGEILIDGSPVVIRNSHEAVGQGIAYVSEDRKLKGLVQIKDVQFNSSLVCLGQVSRLGFVDRKLEKEDTEKQIRTLRIKTSGRRALVSHLSGGNQQKVVLAKWLMMENLKVLMLDEPTRGIDVGAKAEIYELINALSSRGIPILLITSELPELLGLSDRIVVIREGRIAGELRRSDATQETVMALCV